MFREYRGNTNGFSVQKDPNKSKRPMLRTLEPRMVFDAAAAATVEQAAQAPAHHPPAGEGAHPAVAEPAWGHLAEALKPPPAPPMEKSTVTEGLAAIKPIVAEATAGIAKGADALPKPPEFMGKADEAAEHVSAAVEKVAMVVDEVAEQLEASRISVHDEVARAIHDVREKSSAPVNADAATMTERPLPAPPASHPSGEVPKTAPAVLPDRLVPHADGTKNHPASIDPPLARSIEQEIDSALASVPTEILEARIRAHVAAELASNGVPAPTQDHPAHDPVEKVSQSSTDEVTPHKSIEPAKSEAPANETPEQHLPPASDRVVTDPRASEAKSAEATPTADATESTPTEVYFIWDNVKDWQQIVASLGPNARVYVLDSNKDGVEQIAAILKGQHNISAIHIISHGSEGSLTLGTAVLDADSMQGEYRDELETIGQALTPDGDILIYGCDFAAGADGLEAAVILGGITHADVAASTDATGAASLGGDWVLERQTGTIETKALTDDGYQYLLANPVVDLDGAQVGVNTVVSYTEQAAAVSIVAAGAGNGATITDADNNLQSITIVANAAPNGNSEHLNFNGTAIGLGSNSTTLVTVGGTTYKIVYTASTRTFVITNNAGGTIPSGGSTNTLVRSITYDNSSDNPTNGGANASRIFTFTATDTTAGTSPGRTATVNITAVNDAPVDGNETNNVIEDTTLTVADGATGDLLNNATDGDGNPLTITAFTVAGVTGPFTIGTPKVITGVGTLTINANGSYSFAPGANYTGAIPVITYTVSDGAGGTDTSTLTLTMVAVNDAPSGANNTVTINEDTAYTFSAASFGFTDPNDSPANTLQSVIITTLPPAAQGTLLLSGVAVTAGQTITLAQLANLTFQPAANVNGSGIGSFTFQVVDNGGTANGGQNTDQSPNTFAFNVTAVNDPPVDGNETNTVTEDTTLTVADGAAGDLLNNATDPDGNALTITGYTIAGVTGTQSVGSAVAIAGVGTITINANGSYSFTPAANYTGAIPVITYTVSDGVGGTDTSTLTLTMVPVNDPPVDGDETNSVNEDTTLSVAAAGGLLANATDIDGGPLTVSGFTVAGQSGPFVVGTGYAIAGVGTITVNSDGSYNFAPATNYVGPVPVVTYTVSDGAGGTDTSTLTLTVVAVNDAPAGTDNTATITEDTSYTFSAASFRFTDPNDSPANAMQAVIITTLPSASEGTLLLSGVAVTAGQTIPVAQIGNLTFQPAADVNGNGVGSFTFQVVDDGGTANGGQNTDQSPNTFAFNITAVNDAPVAADDTGTTPEETPLNVPAGSGLLSNDTDVDGDSLTITQFSALGFTATAGQTGTIPGVGDITVNSDGSYNFVPVANFSGPVPTITYTVSDGHGGTDTAVLNITVTPVNDPPMDGDETNSVTEDTTLSVPADSGLLANTTDIDGGPPSVVEFSVAGQTGPFTVGTPYAISGVGTITIAADGSYSFTPVANYDGPIPVITYTVSDGNGGTDTSTLTLTMVPVNDPPDANDDAATTPENTPVSGNVLDNDTDIDSTNLRVTTFEINGVTYGAGTTDTFPGIGSIGINADGSYTFTPAPGYDGPVPEVTYTVSDGEFTDTAVLRLTITPVNDPPVASDDTGTTPEDTTLNGNVLTNDTDPDGDTLAVTEFVVGGTTYAAGDTATITDVGTLTVRADGSYTFVPATNYNGPVPVATYTVTDGTLTDEGALTITVTPVNDPPATTDDTGTTPEDTTLNGNVLTNDTDVDGDTLTVVGFSVNGIPGTFFAGADATIPGVGTVTVNSDGSYTLVPAANYHGPVPEITYIVTDGNGDTATGTLDLVVTPVNDPPIANDDTAQTPENTSLNGNVISNDTDVDGDTITVTGFDVNGNHYAPGQPATIPGVGTLTIDTDGDYTFVPAPGYTGPVPDVTYTISDGNGESDQGNLHIDVIPIDNGIGAIDDTATTPEDTTLTGNVVANDVDPDGNPITVTSFTLAGDIVVFPAGSTAHMPGIGDLTIEANGDYTFVPAPNYNGPVPVATYTATDGTQSDTATLTITVTPVNDAPVAVDDTATTAEDTTVSGSVLTNDSDVEGDTLSVTQFTIGSVNFTAGQTAIIPTVGRLTINTDGTYTFVPFADYNGPVPVATYTVSDGHGGTDTATLTINVTPVNDAPVAVDDTATTAEDTTLTGNVLTNDTDVDGTTPAVTEFTVAGVTGTFAAGETATITGVGNLTIDADGGYTFVPAPDYNGPVPVATYTASDGTLTDTATLTITVIPVNDPPVAADDSATLAEDTTLTVPASSGLLANDTDVDGGPLSVGAFEVDGIIYGPGTTATIAGVGALTINADGSYAFTPVANYNGPVPDVTYAVVDGNGGSATAVLTINVTPVNDEPVAADDTATTAEDTPLNGEVLGNDTDIDGDTLSVSQFTIAGDARVYTAGETATIGGVGTLKMNADGTYTFQPAADYNGPVPVVTYTASDSHGGTDTATLTINITPVNDAPAATDDIGVTDEDTTLSVPAATGLLSNDVDVDGDSLSISSFSVDGTSFIAGATATVPGVGTLTIMADGSYTFVPVANYNGPGPVATYTVTDGHGGTDTAVLTITVTPVNDPPVDGDETNSVTEDTTLSVAATSGLLVNTTDIDGGPPVVAGFTVAGETGTFAVGTGHLIVGVGTITINADGSYSFAPAANYDGPIPVITYTVSDGAGGTDTSTLTLTMVPVNDPPVDGDETGLVIEDTTRTVSADSGLLANATDIDGGPLSVSAFTVAGQSGPFEVGTGYLISGVGTITINADGSYSFAPAANYDGPIPVITYTVSDGRGGTDTSTLTLTMVPVNDAPVAADDTGTTPEDTTLTGNVLTNDTDVENDALSVTQFVVDGTTYTPGETAAVAGVGTLTIGANGNYAFVPVSNYNGPGPVATYTISDGHGGTDTAVLTITVTPVNDPPVDGDETNTVIEDTTLNVPAASGLLANAGDIDGGALSVASFTVAGETGSFAVGTGHLIAGVGTITIDSDGGYSFVPVADYNGPVPVITYTVSDGAGGTDTSTLTLTVTPVNDPPVDGDESNSVTEDTTLTVPAATGLLANTSDVDGGPPAVTGFTVAGETGTFAVGTGHLIAGVGTITINADGSYTFTPAANYAGPIPVITYTVSDGNGGTDTSTLTLTMIPVNDPPVATDDTATTPEDTTLEGNVLANDTDIDGGALSVTQFTVDGTTYAAGQTATIAGVGTLTIGVDGDSTFVPALNYNGPVPVATYTISDGNGGTDTATLTITVTPVNDPPVAADDTATTAEDTTLTGNVLTNDTDVDGGALSVTQFVVDGTTYAAGQTATVTGVGTLTVEGNGGYTFVPAADYNGPVPVATYTVSDGNGGSDTATLTITVTPVNDAPVGNDDTETTPEDTTLTGNVLTNDTDVDGDTLSVTQFIVEGTTYNAGETATVAGVGTLTIGANGVYTFVPVADYNGPGPVATYTLSDGALTDTATLTITVTPVNDPPVATDDVAVTPEDTPLNGNVLTNDSDIDHDTLSVTQFVVNGTTYAAGQSATVDGVGRLTIGGDGNYAFIPALNYNGAGPIATYTVSDGHGGTDTATLTITITPVNDPPGPNPDRGAIPSQRSVDSATVAPVLVSTFFFDPDGDRLTYSAAGLPPGLSINPTTGVISGTLPNDASQHSPYVVRVTATDPSGASGTEIFIWTVTNPAPIAVDDAASVPEDTALTGTVLTNDSDPDHDPLTVTAFDVGGTTYAAGQTATISGVGSLVINADGSYTFTPVLNFNGPVPAATYTLSDGNGGLDTAVLAITVTPVNDPPVLVDDHASGNEDTTLTGNVLGNDTDPDNDQLVVTGFSIDGDPTHYLPGETATIAGIGTLSLRADGNYTFIPAPNYNGPVPNVLYTASDGHGGSGQATLVITIRPVDDFVPIPENNEPDLPSGPDYQYNPDNVDGAVVEAVRGLDSLNDIAALSERPIHAGVNAEHPPIRFALTSFLGGSSTIVIDLPSGGDEKIEVEAIKHGGILYLQITDRVEGGGENTILGYRLRAADGAAGPVWLTQVGPRTFAGHPDAGAGTVDLILSVVQRDGRVSEHELLLDSVSGQLSQPPATQDHGFEERLAPMFSEQMNRSSLSQHFALLERALGFR